MNIISEGDIATDTDIMLISHGTRILVNEEDVINCSEILQTRQGMTMTVNATILFIRMLVDLCKLFVHNSETHPTLSRGERILMTLTEYFKDPEGLDEVLLKKVKAAANELKISFLLEGLNSRLIVDKVLSSKK